MLLALEKKKLLMLGIKVKKRTTHILFAIKKVNTSNTLSMNP